MSDRPKGYKGAHRAGCLATAVIPVMLAVMAIIGACIG